MKPAALDPRRRVLFVAEGGLILAAFSSRRAGAANEIVISMAGTPTGAHVWFRPQGLLIQAGQAIRWENREVANVHTVTAYHPDNGKPLRIPDDAQSWNSGYLMPGESFTRVFHIPGVYDYYCIPHEHAGMVGRIVVGHMDASVHPYQDSDALLPAAALAGLPSVAQILQDKQVVND